ncbi:MAG: hypothetical protein OXE99_02960 [Cellvibrionales bacterium]|nr:hypothetical protein [Cellvibrionales bacterium]
MIKRMLSIAVLLCLSLSVFAHKSYQNPFFKKGAKHAHFSKSAWLEKPFKKKMKGIEKLGFTKKSWSPWKPGKKLSQLTKGKWKGIPFKTKKGKYCKVHPKPKLPAVTPPEVTPPEPPEDPVTDAEPNDPPILGGPTPEEDPTPQEDPVPEEDPIPDGVPNDQDPIVDDGDQDDGDSSDNGDTADNGDNEDNGGDLGDGEEVDDQDPIIPGEDNPPLDGPEAPMACMGGLYGIDNYAGNGQTVLYHIDINTGISSPLAGSSYKASNLASYNNKLYYIHQTSSETRASNLIAYDPATEQEMVVASTESYPIYRFAISPLSGILKATSKTYLYHFDKQTAEKSVIGQLSYAGDDFKHGDLGYSHDGHLLYLLTGKGLYSLDTEGTELMHIADHGIAQASGIATTNDNRTFVSAGNNQGGADIYEIDLSTGVGEKLFSVDHHVNDLAYIPYYCE